MFVVFQAIAPIDLGLGEGRNGDVVVEVNIRGRFGGVQHVRKEIDLLVAEVLATLRNNVSNTSDLLVVCWSVDGDEHRAHLPLPEID